ncbi:MAG: hypothetical protein SFU25_02705 [Candidatus Caenarcaniphilales bacterium]|nr:hypothetical protein [Candidatus Caenarcaniphilales bacterium]
MKSEELFKRLINTVREKYFLEQNGVQVHWYSSGSCSVKKDSEYHFVCSSGNLSWEAIKLIEQFLGEANA